MNRRIFVSTFEQYDFESKELIKELKNALSLTSLINAKIYVVYDIFNISTELLNEVKYKIFARVNMDNIQSNIPICKNFVTWEMLPLQFDNRADSAMQLINLFHDKKNPIKVKSGMFVQFNDELTSAELALIKSYLINPIVYQEKDLSIFDDKLQVNHKEISIIENFTNFNTEQLTNLKNKGNFSLAIEDLKLIQTYFQKEKRNPNSAELMMFDTYWSDHCRHTTFNTTITDVEFNLTDEKLNHEIKKQYHHFLQRHKKINNRETFSLMDLSTIIVKEQLQNKKLTDLEKSKEINAISIKTKINNKPHYLVFKNETHNHPTEIAPFGGASTCLGGAIRDVLASRAYCFAGIRLSGCANILEKQSQTLEGKLMQSKIAKEATRGFSSYGNQLGLSTIYVDEYYHEQYKAKHLECGAVLGVVPKSWVKKSTPAPGDLIMLIGGETGIDGIGGASGSSKILHNKSVEQSASEVQRGDPLIARKMQRLFKTNKKFIKLIKRCNDFGAGGASVAIGEIADGMEIYLDKFQVKYLNISPKEILFSESQERMAMVISPKNKAEFIKYASKENLDAYMVGKVIKQKQVKAFYNKDLIINISRAFLNSNGYKHQTKVNISDANSHINTINKEFTYDNEINKLKNKLKKGLIETFDGTIGASSLLNTMGGKHLLTQSDVAIAKIPSPITTKHDTNVIVASGFNSEIAGISAYHMGFYSVIETLSKLVSKHVSYENSKISLQEYFPRMNNPKKWALPLTALLGAYKVLRYFDLPVVGGKDSMSGTFKNIDVIPTLITFGINTFKTKPIISNTLQDKPSYIYLLHHGVDENNLLHLHQYKKNLKWFLNHEDVIASSAISNKTIQMSLIHMALGNHIGININSSLIFDIYPGDIIFQTSKMINRNEDAILLGKTISEKRFIFNGVHYDINKVVNDLKRDYEMIYPFASYLSNNVDFTNKIITHKVNDSIILPPLNKKKCVILHPVFPGTNCEYDVINKFTMANKKVVNDIFVFKNQTNTDINTSIAMFAKKIKQADIINLSGGFSLGDEPDGSAKYIVCILSHPTIKKAILAHLAQKKLILGICNGFQALINAGLLPYGEFKIKATSPALSKNPIGKHIATLLNMKYLNVNSPWINESNLTSPFTIPISHGEGCFVANNKMLDKLIQNNQIASVYTDEKGEIIGTDKINPNNSKFNIEAIVSPNGLILGKMGHSERVESDLYQNVKPIKVDPLFENGVNYILGVNK